MTNQTKPANTSVVVREQRETQALVEQAGFTVPQVNLLRKTIAVDCTLPEISLFMQYSHRAQLDPFSRQIYAIKRGGKLTIQISIDGFRVIAERTGNYEGQEEPKYLDTDGNWHDVWLPTFPGITQEGEPGGQYPVAARVGVFRKGWRAPIYAQAKMTAYAQWGGAGLWQRMPELMLSKCAEALALRKAFPNDLSGLYSHDEMDQAGPVRVEIEGRTVAELDADLANDPEDAGPPMDGEVIDPPARKANTKSEEEQQWERENPPAQAAARSVAGARTAPQRPAPAPSTAPVAPTPAPANTIKTVPQLMVWAAGTYGMDEAAVFAACGVADKKGIQNLGLTKSIAAVEASVAAVENANDDSAGAADAADQAGDVDPDELPF